MSNDAFASVWDAIETSPEDAENMKIRSKLMSALEQHVRQEGWTQAEAARRLGVTQPRISDLLHGKITLFSIDTLVTLLVKAGLHVDMHIRNAA